MSYRDNQHRDGTYTWILKLAVIAWAIAVAFDLHGAVAPKPRMANPSCVVNPMPSDDSGEGIEPITATEDC